MTPLLKRTDTPTALYPTMKAYLTIQTDGSRIFGAGATKEAAQADALRWTDSLTDTKTIYADVNVTDLSQIDAHTTYAEIAA